MTADVRGPGHVYLWSVAWHWLTLYRQLFAWIVAFNLITLVLAATGKWEWANRHRVQFAVTNTLITSLTRNEVCRATLSRPVFSSGRCLVAGTESTLRVWAGVLACFIQLPGQGCDRWYFRRAGQSLGTMLGEKPGHKLLATLWRHTQWLWRQQSDLAHLLSSVPCHRSCTVHGVGEDLRLRPHVPGGYVVCKRHTSTTLQVSQRL